MKSVFGNMFGNSISIDLKIEGFDPQNPGFGPFRTPSDIPILPPKTAARRYSKIVSLPQVRSLKEIGLFGNVRDQKVLDNSVKGPCLRSPL